MSTLELSLYASSLFLLPLVIWSLVAGSKVPENTWFSPYYAAERYLGLVGNVFLLVLCGNSFLNLALHFGWVGGHLGTTLTQIAGATFGVVLVADLMLWSRAVLRVRRGKKTST